MWKVVRTTTAVATVLFLVPTFVNAQTLTVTPDTIALGETIEMTVTLPPEGEAALARNHSLSMAFFCDGYAFSSGQELEIMVNYEGVDYWVDATQFIAFGIGRTETFSVRYYCEGAFCDYIRQEIACAWEVSTSLLPICFPSAGVPCEEDFRASSPPFYLLSRRGPDFISRTIPDQLYHLNVEISPVTLPAARGAPPLTYTLTPALPSDLSFDGNARVLSGTPVALSPESTYTYTVTDGNGDKDTLTFPITVIDAGPTLKFVADTEFIVADGSVKAFEVYLDGFGTQPDDSFFAEVVGDDASCRRVAVANSTYESYDTSESEIRQHVRMTASTGLADDVVCRYRVTHRGSNLRAEVPFYVLSDQDPELIVAEARLPGDGQRYANTIHLRRFGSHSSRPFGGWVTVGTAGGNPRTCSTLGAGDPLFPNPKLFPRFPDDGYNDVHDWNPPTPALERGTPDLECIIQATTPGLERVAQVTMTFHSVQSFTDDPIVAGSTVVKAVHITELRDRIDALRVGLGMTRYPWTDSTIISGVTPVRALHLSELRAALAAAYSAGGWSLIFSTEQLRPGEPILGSHIDELRRAVAVRER